MSSFVDVKIRLKIKDSCPQSQIWTADGESEWLPVNDTLPRLAEALNHLSGVQEKHKSNVYRTEQMKRFFGKSSDSRRKLLNKAIESVSLERSELRILLEPVDEGSRLSAYNLPAEIWSFSSGHLEPDNPLPSIVRLVQQDYIAAQPVYGKWRIAWMGGHRSIDTLRNVMNDFRASDIQFVGAFPLVQPKDLRESLETSAANIVWLVGTGDQENSAFFLSENRKMGVDELCSAFRGMKSLQLLFIHSCHLGNLSVGLAERLIREAGIPMVVTWETRNGSDEGLLERDILHPFANKFFSHFRDGEPAEVALAKARNHLFYNVDGAGIVNCKICPLAFKATGAEEIQITKRRRPFISKDPYRKALQRLSQAYQFEEALQSDKAVEIYRTLINCDDKAIARIAAVRLQLISC